MTTLDEISARADKATEGPWETGGMDSGHSMFETNFWVTTERGDSICDMDGLGRALNEALSKDDGLADAEFIAHAREDVPRLVAALRAVEAKCVDADKQPGPFKGITSTAVIRIAIRDALR